MTHEIIRLEEGRAFLNAIEDPITKNLVRVAAGMLTVRALPFQKPGSPNERYATPPASPVDYEFFVRLMRDLFEKRDFLQRLMSGESLESADGWGP